jgi:TonB family protein
MRMKLIGKVIVGIVFLMACVSALSFSGVHAAPVFAVDDFAADDATLSSAICPIVYPVDQSPSNRGYHYLFYGNGFFINEHGYFITAAHVLSQLHGGQPYILLKDPSGRPQFIRAELVILDRSHDVAVLRATANPFDGKHAVRYLPLASDWIARSESILVASMRPSAPLDAYTLDRSVEDRASGEVVDFKFSQLEKGRSDTELFLFNHQVRLGQSGAPVLSSGAHEVVGIIEGQWLRPEPGSIPAAKDQGTPGVGAAVPIHYAIALLKQKKILWHTNSETISSGVTPEQPKGFSLPTPLSIVGCAYPSQAIFGGEVVLDSLIDNQGRVMQMRVVRGTSPFLEEVLSAVQTWSFYPATLDGQPVAARIGITFQFSRPDALARKQPPHTFDKPSTVWADRGALPIFTVEPRSSAVTEGEGGVILYDVVAADGHLSSVKVLGESQSNASASVAALQQWRFIPGRRDGANSDSAGLVVMAIRRDANTTNTGQKQKP